MPNLVLTHGIPIAFRDGIHSFIPSFNPPIPRWTGVHGEGSQPLTADR